MCVCVCLCECVCVCALRYVQILMKGIKTMKKVYSIMSNLQTKCHLTNF